METSFFVVGMVVFTMLSAFFSATETALFSMSSIRLKSYKQDQHYRKKLVATLLSKPKDLLVTILMMNILANILVQNAASNLFGNFSGWSLKVGIPLLLTLLFGEIIPKSLALQNNEWLSYRVSPMIAFIQRLLGPSRTFVTIITTYLYRTLFFFLKKEQSISKEELHHILRTSEKNGLLHTDEARLVNGYLNLQDASVKELMRPREDVILYETKKPLEHLIHLFKDQECSRIPVSKDGLDRVQGIITAQHYFRHREKIKTPDDLLNFLLKPFFIPETMLARTLLRELREKNEKAALVVDEYGCIIGLITNEDLVELVVGPITDRRDEKKHYTRAGHDIIIASGKFELAEFNDFFDIELPSKNNMVTIGGWLTEQLGDIPKSGTKHIYNGFLFHVLATDPNRVRRVYIRKLSSSGPMREGNMEKDNG